MISPPYPSETRAKGWRFEIDIDQVMQSDTWVLAPPEIRPWLLMIWTISWQQLPCGSLPSDDAVIAARIGMKASVFAKHKSILLRGWEEATDGRLYHPTITQRVLAMTDTKQREKDRKAAYRAKMSGNVPRDNQGTDTGQTPDGRGIDPGRDATRTRTGTGTGTGTSLNTSTSQSRVSAHEPEKFPMRIDWQPSAHVDDQAKQALVRITPQLQQEFIAHWLTQPDKLRSQAEWDKALLQSALHQKAAGPPKSRDGPKPENFDQRDYGQGVQSL